MSTHAQPKWLRILRWTSGIILGVLVYILSSGPVLAVAFWMRQHTGRDEFYWVMGLYYPLAWLGPDSIFHEYVGWWCWLFDTVGPG